MSTLFNPDKEKYEISVWEDQLIPQTTEGDKVILEHFEEQKIATIGAHDMDTPAAASNPTFVENVNGSYTLTFSMYYRYFDEDEMEYVENPFTQLLHNERKIKLYYRNKWYDLVIKNCVEDSSNYTFTYTAKSFYTTELGKNGFKVELDSELYNNQGTNVELGETILKGTDWEIIPTEESLSEDKKKEWTDKYGEDFVFSDIIVQTKIEPLYIGTLNQEIQVQLVNSYLPDKEAENDNLATITSIAADKKVLFFYSDINNKEKQPQILYRPDGDYKTDVNEDIITNSYNYRIIYPEVLYTETTLNNNTPNISDSEFIIFNGARGEKVIRSTETGYDPDLEEYITYYKKDDKEYYGYQKTESLSSSLTQNFLANSDDFTSTDIGWIFDGTPNSNNNSENGAVIDNNDATFTGQIYLLNQEDFSYDLTNQKTSESVLELKLQSGENNDSDEKNYYLDSNGEYYKIMVDSDEKYVLIDSDTAKRYEENIRAIYYNKKQEQHKDFVGKTDAELDAIIDSVLRSQRYSTRKKVAINTGVAANRKIIENFSEGEQYVFAVSLGKYKDEEASAPEYGREIRYGAKEPTELYQFINFNENIANSYAFMENVYLETISEITNNSDKYYDLLLKNNSSAQEIYDTTYKNSVEAAVEEYKQTYLKKVGLIDVVNDTIKNNWKKGGSNFREVFLDALKDSDNNSSYYNLVISALTNQTGYASWYESLYEKPKEGFFENGYVVAYNTREAEKQSMSEFSWAFVEGSWEKSGNDGQYPTLDANYSIQENSINSFCAQLYAELYNAIKEKYIGIDGPVEDFSDLGEIIEVTFRNVAKNFDFSYANQYKLPSPLNPKGGVKYQEAEQEWLENAKAEAKKAVQNSYNIFYYQENFNTPVQVQLITVEKKYETIVKELQSTKEPSYIGSEEYWEELISKFDDDWSVVFGYGFALLYIQIKKEKIETDITSSTYTLNEDEYEIVDEAISQYVAIPESALSETEKEIKGFHVLDKEDSNKIRLYDREKDAMPALYIPEKNENGEYVYDPTLTPNGGYRKYRGWSSEEYRDPNNPQNKLSEENGGKLGDIIHHSWKAFDGQLGSWDEKPIRYNFRRVYIDPETRKYLTEEQDGYPIGYQLDHYQESDDGEYILSTSLEGNNNAFSEFWQKFFGMFKVSKNNTTVSTRSTEQENPYIFTGTLSDETKDTIKSILDPIDIFKVGLSEKFIKWLDEKVEAFIGFTEEVLNTEVIGIGNITIGDIVSKISGKPSFGTIGISTDNSDENIALITTLKAQDAEGKDYVISKPATTATYSDTQVEYIKYRFWYWKHWGKKRYTLMPKICVKPFIDSDEEYRTYNNVTDAENSNYYKIYEKNDTSIPNIEDKTEKKYLTLKNRSYRSLKETDFSPAIYSPELQTTVNRRGYVKDEKYNYYRPFQNTDLKWEFRDYILQQWVDTYIFVEVENPDLTSLSNQYYILVDGKYIPYEPHLYQLAQQRYNRIRVVTDIDDIINSTTHYVANNGIYTTAKTYYDENTKLTSLNYSGLRVYFTPNYSYDTSYFAIKDVEGWDADKQEPIYLGLEIGNETPQLFDTTVMSTSSLEDTIKERWCYWILTVKKGFSLTQDSLSSLGMVFESNSSNKNFTFLGMQLFKYIEYEKEDGSAAFVIPGEAPDAKDLTLTSYYIYDPAQSTSKEDVIYEYRGQNPEEAGFSIKYDDLCQKIRSIKGKESNYFKLLQDICDTFECWMEQVIPHDNMGRVSYIDQPVYEQNNAADNEEPQIYIRELPEEVNEEDYSLKGYIRVPDKKIRFKEYVGKSNYAGFKYGVNLQSIKRTLDSDSITSRIIVKANSNEYATDGFCTIQRAKENILKENFIYDFTYYINKGLLKYSEINPDLYSSNPDKLGYYVKLARLNEENDQISTNLASIIIQLDKVNADYETAVLGRDAAQEEIAKLVEILKNNYDTYGNLIDVPWTYNKSKEYLSKTETSSEEKEVTLTNEDGESYVVTIPKMTTVVEYPKYNDTLRNYFDQMDTYQRNFITFSNKVDKFKIEKERLEAERDNLLALEKEIVEKKNELNKLFYHKYSRYIQEGSWVDENYIDDNLYYLDSLAVLRTSCVPKITYDINVIDLYGAIGYEEDRIVLNYELGDRTYIEDTEFFGYVKDTNRPYQEQIVISEKTYVLEDNSQNKIQVKNYSTQFDSLFQRIAATSQTLQFNEGSYGRVSSILNTDGSINADRIQQALDSASLAFKNSVNEDVYWDHTGIWIRSFENEANILRLTSFGIGMSTDGGNTYITAITGDGINAAAINGGMLNIDKLMIGAKSTPNFLWNRSGISSFKTLEDGIDYSTFVRLDQYGIYGIKNWSKDGTSSEQMSINDTFEPLRLSDITENENAVFGLTWDGFFLNTGSGSDRGRVTIGTSQDIRMSVKDEAGWHDRVIIGKLTDATTNEETYGFRLVNENNEIVLDTNLQGELYLKRKLRISNFTNEMRYNQDLKYDENGNIIQGDNQSLTTVEDRVTLGIVNTYDRQKNYAEIELSGVYSSSQYLTKVFSVKVNDNVGIEQFANDPYTLGLIKENETFAIFDNGNLYAKNAWIEGHIQAESGTIGNLEIENGGIQTKSFDILDSTNGWRITPEEARFNNVIVSGSIKAATFEYQEIQTIGGTFLIRPTAVVESYEFLTFEEFCNKYNVALPSTLSENRYLVLTLNSQMGHTNGNIIKIIPKNKNNSLLEGTNQNEYLYLTINSQVVDSKTIIFVYLEENDYKTLNLNLDNATIIDIGQNSSNNKDIGIVFNSSNENIIFPSNGISIFETWSDGIVSEGFSWKIKNRIFLGKIPEINDQDEVSNHIAKIFEGRDNSIYGLYADNVYLNGALEVKGINTFAGIDTLNKKTIKEAVGDAILSDWQIKADGKIVLYGGTHNQEGTNTTYQYNFVVDEYGNLFANSGYFKGTLISDSIIQASEIKTAKITGIDKGDYGLSIFGGGKAIRFALSEDVSDFFSLNSDELKVTIPSNFTNSINANVINWSNNIRIDSLGIQFSNTNSYKYNIIGEKDYLAIQIKNNTGEEEDNESEKFISKFKINEIETVLETNLKLNSDKTQSSIKYEAVKGGYDIYVTAS